MIERILVIIYGYKKEMWTFFYNVYLIYKYMFVTIKILNSLELFTFTDKIRVPLVLLLKSIWSSISNMIIENIT